MFRENMTKTITVDDDVWADLLRLKADLKVRTYSEVLRRLIEKWKKT
jgi:predicted CopG family antitoxin